MENEDCGLVNESGEITRQSTQNTTVEGVECVGWSKERYPQYGGHNYCRNPDDTEQWCFIDSEETEWENCETRSCGEMNISRADSE